MGERGSGTRDKILDGLRGVAALMVFLIHANGMGLRELGQIGNSIAAHGKYGVTVFFVVSAYSLCLSVSPAFDGRPVSWPGYFARRAFRIIPMYFFALAAFAAIGLVEIKSTSSLIAHVTFANIVRPEYANDILHVEWSIAVEVAFYLLFPVLMLVRRTRHPIFSLFLVAVLVFAARPWLAEALGDAFWNHRGFNILWHLHTFLIGIACFIWIRRGDHTSYPPWLCICGAALLTGLSIIVGEGHHSAPAFAIATALIITGFHQGSRTAEWLSSPMPVFAGRISYSIYLLHAPIIWSLAGPAGLAAPLWMTILLGATICIALVTYCLVEKPMIEIGRRFAVIISPCRSAPALS
jgi:peptidoglycan/LPS O-acetylase OafA/YrhL